MRWVFNKQMHGVGIDMARVCCVLGLFSFTVGKSTVAGSWHSDPSASATWPQKCSRESAFALIPEISMYIAQGPKPELEKWADG